MSEMPQEGSTADNADEGVGENTPQTEPTNQSLATGGNREQPENSPAETQEVPETPDIKLELGENSRLAQSDIDDLTKFSSAKGLDQKTVDNLRNMAERAVAGHIQRESTRQSKEQESWKKVVQNDPEIGLSQFDTSLEQCSRALERFGTKELTELFDSGIGNHPEIVRFVARVGSAMSDDSWVSGGNPREQKTLGEIFYPNGH